MKTILLNFSNLIIRKTFLLLFLIFTAFYSTAQLNCDNAINLSSNVLYQGNTSNGNSNVSTYNNDGWWQLTGPEVIHKIDWGGGSIDIELTNKGANLDLILLSSCDQNGGFLASGGGNSGRTNSKITRNLNQGTYFIVVDGWQNAQGSYSLEVKEQVSEFDCDINAVDLATNTLFQGNTNNGNSVVSTYNNDSWWKLTGPEMIHKLDWQGGQINIGLTNKSASMDLILLSECDENSGFVESGGGNSGTADSGISRYLDSGIYYIIVDGWEGASGTYDLFVREFVTVNVGSFFNPDNRTFTLENNILYQVTTSGSTQVETNVESFGKSFGYVDSSNNGNQKDVLWIKKIGEAKPRIYLNNNFNTQYLKQKLNCSQNDLDLYGNYVFDGNSNILENSDILRCENGNTLSHQRNGQIKLYQTSNSSWLDVRQIISINAISYYIKQDDNSVWKLESGNASMIGTNASLLQDNDNELIKIDSQGNYQRWNGGSWLSITPKYVGVSPEMIDEGFWFFIQSKNLLNSGSNISLDHKMGLTFNNSGAIVMSLIPSTGNCEEFLWKTKDLGNGKRILVNKAKGENFPLLINANGVATFTDNNASNELEIKVSNKDLFGTNAYNIIGVNNTKALSYNNNVATGSPISSDVNQTWVFQFNQMVKDYFLPLPNQDNLQTHYENTSVNAANDADEVLMSYNKFLKGDNGVTFFGTKTTSDWVVANYYFIINNMMNAIVSPVPSFGGHSSRELSALKGQSLIIIGKNDLNSVVPRQYFTSNFNTYSVASLRGSAGFANSLKWNLVSEELTCKTGIVNRPLDRSFRRFDHGVHEFNHTFQGILDWIPLVDGDNMCPSEKGRNSECFCFDVQNWFDSSNGQNKYPNSRANSYDGKSPSERTSFLEKIFKKDNTWMPPKDIRSNGYNPSGPTAASTLSTENITANAKVFLYPNPTNGKLTVDIPSSLSPKNLIIYNLVGKKVYQQKLDSNRNNLDLFKLKAGVYFVKIFTNNTTLTKKIIIE